MAMGGREVGDLIEAAWRGGARFDGWSESFDAGIWRRAAAALGVELGGPELEPTERCPGRRRSAGHDAFLRGEAGARGAARPPRTAATAPARRAACAAARSRWTSCDELVARGLRARRRRALHLAPRHHAGRAAHVRPGRHRARPLPGHAAQAAPVAAAALPTGAAALDELAVVEVAEETPAAVLPERLGALRGAAAEGFVFERLTVARSGRDPRPRPPPTNAACGRHAPPCAAPRGRETPR